MCKLALVELYFITFDVVKHPKKLSFGLSSLGAEDFPLHNVAMSSRHDIVERLSDIPHAGGKVLSPFLLGRM